MSGCWARKPRDRPHFYNLVADFSATLDTMAEYFDLSVSDGTIFAPIAEFDAMLEDEHAAKSSNDADVATTTAAAI